MLAGNNIHRAKKIPTMSSKVISKTWNKVLFSKKIRSKKYMKNIFQKKIGKGIPKLGASSIYDCVYGTWVYLAARIIHLNQEKNTDG